MRTFCKNKKILANSRKSKIEEGNKTDSTSLVSFDEKLEMSEKLRKVTPDILAAYVKLVQTECPEALQELDKERIHIKLDSLDKPIFDKLSE